MNALPDGWHKIKSAKDRRVVNHKKEAIMVCQELGKPASIVAYPLRHARPEEAERFCARLTEAASIARDWDAELSAPPPARPAEGA